MRWGYSPLTRILRLVLPKALNVTGVPLHLRNFLKLVSALELPSTSSQRTDVRLFTDLERPIVRAEKK